jgi:hypothetical protein
MLLRVSKRSKTPPLKSAETTSLSRIDRREFIKTSSLAAGALAFGVPAFLRGQNLNSKLNIACIGIGGKGRSDTDACAGENIVGLCDVDSGSAAYAMQTKKYPSARFYKDFRQLKYLSRQGRTSIFKEIARAIPRLSEPRAWQRKRQV